VINPKALERLDRAIKDVHAAAMMCKGDSWTLHEELIHEKEDLGRILKRMEAQWLEEANRRTKMREQPSRRFPIPKPPKGILERSVIRRP
jgi:hypothetical protein